jgi:mannose-6-phosphate isomerase
MFYPFKFKPVYKDYIWGGRNLEKYGKVLPDGIVAESWEISCHPDGTSIISNGNLQGILLPEVIKKFGIDIVGNKLPGNDLKKFPLLVKLIDANNDLSVQVHPDDNYAFKHENGEYGKNEAWYIISAKPGSKLIYDVVPGITREDFRYAVEQNRIEDCLKYVSVSEGDIIDIPAGLLHAIGSGIILAEVQQNSNTTYRVYDYNRTDTYGNKRPLHIEKALDVIDFNNTNRKEKYRGLKIDMGNAKKTFLVANRYFCIELVEIDGQLDDNADGSRFYIYTFLEGNGNIICDSGKFPVKMGESVLIPASLGKYTIEGHIKGLCSFVPDIEVNVVTPLRNAGYSLDDIYENFGSSMK